MPRGLPLPGALALALAAAPARARDGGAPDGMAPGDARAQDLGPSPERPPAIRNNAEDHAHAAAEETRLVLASRGELALESRLFRDDGNPLSADRGLGLFGRLEWRAARGRLEAKARGFGRMDRYDEGRTIVVAEEAWLGVRWPWLRLRAGVDLVNWTATEAFHPADILNARNLDSDLENYEKVGEPMAEIQVRPFDGTTFDVYLMPIFTSPLTTSTASRLGFAPPGVDIGALRRLLDRHGRPPSDDFGPQGAAQLRQRLGPADLTAHVVHHMDRGQPFFVQPAGPLVFQTVTQVGGTVQAVAGASAVVKLEWAWRRFVPPAADEPLRAVIPDRDHGAVAAGLEYGLPHAGGAESNVVVEGQALWGVPRPVRRGLSAFSRAALAGWRFAANDEASREVFVGVLVDLETREQFLVNAQYRQRLGETWTVAAGLRIFEAPAPAAGSVPSALQLLRKADHVRLTLTRHF